MSEVVCGVEYTLLSKERVLADSSAQAAMNGGLDVCARIRVPVLRIFSLYWEMLSLSLSLSLSPAVFLCFCVSVLIYPLFLFLPSPYSFL